MYDQGKCAESIDSGVWMEHEECVPPDTTDGASDTMSEETKTACEAPVLPSSVVLEERVNQRVAHYLKTLTVDDLKKYNPPSKHHCKTEDDFKAALNKLRVFLNACVGKEGGVQRTYRYARGKDFGRMFCSEGIQNVWRAFRGALCKGLMTDIDMKNCHPVVLLWLCEKFEIDCPKLREYVTAREHHLMELGKVLGGKDREHCKRLFLIATNTNQKIKNVSYTFFNEYQAEIQEVIQPALMEIDELAVRFKSHAEQAAGQREADGREANEEGSFLNLVLCYSENVFLQTVRAYLEGKGIEIAVLMLDGLMVYGDHYDNASLLEELHTLLKDKHDIEMHFDYKPHETTVLDDMPEDFDETVVLGDEWHKRHTKDDTSWSTGFLFNIKDEHLHDATDRARILAACHGQGAADGLPVTWECAARKLWSRGGLEADGFDQAWAEAEEAPHHDGRTLRHYSRESNEGEHRQICKRTLGLFGRTRFKETELRDYFLKAVGDDMLCLHQRTSLFVWHQGRWLEDSGPIMAHKLMNLVQELFQGNLSHYEKELSELVDDDEGDGEAANKLRDQVKAIASTAQGYGDAKNQHVLNLIKNDLRANPRYDNPFDNQPHVFAFTNCAYDLTRQRGNEGWFVPNKHDYLLMSCQKPWREPTAQQMANVKKWYTDIQPNEAMRKALLSIHKSGLSGQQFQYFFVLTGGGGNGKDFLGDQFKHLLDETPNGYAAKGHLDLLTKPPKSGPNPEARSLHKKRYVRFAEPNPGQKMEAIRLSNVNELTGCDSIVARNCHSNDTDTHLHNTSAFECNEPPACIGDKGNSAQRRWRWIEFPTTFTADERDLAADPTKFKRIDPKLDNKDFVKGHYCALFKYLVTAEGVWEPGKSLDDYLPKETKAMAKEYLTQNDELSTWFLNLFEQEVKTDGKGHVANFVSLKDVVHEYKEHDIYKCMKAEDKRTFGPKKLKAEFEKNIVLKRSFVQAKKVKLAPGGKYNTQEGLLHYKRKRDDGDEGDGGGPSGHQPCPNAQFGPE
jgi:phage/plasmid-associated DNA primase